ncbi:MAG TPA: 7-cyano-7-deazaguanine synthase [Candidatus Nanoarchaeia archaeon]|nr:7-cyano-7-deazaguanine synthase [Candidatus Nanoarchaeia archaeon]
MSKAIALLSGGIDSPVAIHQLQSQLDIIPVHFHQLPLVDESEIEKVKALAKHLKVKKLYLLPFTPVLKALVEKCNHKHYFILSKIAMFRAAAMIAKTEKANFLITGENLAQVSSQTLSNLTSITTHVPMEIVRPLLTYDKQEIIEVAKQIGTYDLSKGPEICNLLGPRKPSTKSNPEEISIELEKLDLKGLLQECINKGEILEE